MTQQLENQVRGMSEETFEHMKVMFPDGEVMNTVREMTGWE